MKDAESNALETTPVQARGLKTHPMIVRKTGGTIHAPLWTSTLQQALLAAVEGLDFYSTGSESRAGRTVHRICDELDRTWAYITGDSCDFDKPDLIEAYRRQADDERRAEEKAEARRKKTS